MSKTSYRRYMTSILILIGIVGLLVLMATVVAPEAYTAYSAYLLWSGAIIGTNLATPPGGFQGNA